MDTLYTNCTYINIFFYRICLLLCKIDGNKKETHRLVCNEEETRHTDILFLFSTDNKSNKQICSAILPITSTAAKFIHSYGVDAHFYQPHKNRLLVPTAKNNYDNATLAYF